MPSYRNSAVLWGVQQSLSDPEQTQARNNIDAAKNAVATQSTNGLMSKDDKAKLDGIEAGAEANVQADWNQTTTTADDYIKNKPANLVQDADYVHTDNNFTTTLKDKLDGIAAGAEVNVQSDWNQSNTSADDYIKNKPSNLVQDASYVHTDNNYTTADKTKLAGIAAGAEVNVQADWNQTTTTADDYIKNKPENIVQDASYVHTDNNFTTAEKTKLSGIEAGAEVNVQSDWNQTTTTADDYIKNKPENIVQDASYVHTDNNFTTAEKTKLSGIAAGAEVNVQADWNQTITTKDDYIKNKPTNLVQDASYVHTDNNFTTTLKNKLDGIQAGAEVNVQSDWNQSNTSADDYIKNKPANLVQDAGYVHTDNNFTTTLKNKLDGIAAGAEVNVQSDWNQTSTTADDYIKNKPTIPEVVMIQNTQGGSSEFAASKMSIDQDFTSVSLKINATDINVGYLVPNAPQGATTRKVLNLPDGQGNPVWSDIDPSIVYVSISDSYATVNGYRQDGYEVILKVFPTVDNPLYQEFRLMQYNPDGSMEFTCVTSGYDSVYAYKYMLYSNGVWQRTNTGVRSYTGIQIDGIGRNLHLNQNNFVQTNFPGGIWNAPTTQDNIFRRLDHGGFAGAYYLAARFKTDNTYEIGLSYSGSGSSSTITFIGTETIIALDNSVTTKQAAYISETEYYTVSTRFGGNASTAFDPSRHKAIYYSGFGNIGPASDTKIAIWNDNGTVKIGFTSIEVGKVGATN